MNVFFGVKVSCPWREANDEKKNRDILQTLRRCDDVFDGNLYDASIPPKHNVYGIVKVAE